MMNAQSMGAGSDKGVPVPSLRMSLTLAHQSRIRSMYCSRQSLASQGDNSSPASEMGAPASSVSMNNPMSSSRPDSSSSTSSVTDWESGLSTVRRQPPSTAASVKSASGVLGSSRKVEDISAFNEPNLRLRVGTTRKSTDLLAKTSAHPPAQIRRRHRSVERQLDDNSFGADSALGESDGSSYERFSAAVFQHKVQPGKLVNKSAKTSSVANFATRTLHGSKGRIPQPSLDVSPIVPVVGPEHEMADDLSNTAVGQLSGNSRSIQDHIIATQMNRLNREMPISDVYHERNMGLGLAPPLSELLVTSVGAGASGRLAEVERVTAGATSADSVFSAFDQISLADNVTELSDKAELTLKPTSYAKRPPPGRPAKQPWMSSYRTPHRTFEHHLSPVEGSDATMTLRHGIGHAGTLDMTRRDEADGRSMTDSNYSGYSPHRSLKLSTLLPSLQTLGRMTHATIVDHHQDDIAGSDGKKSIHAVAIIEADAHGNTDAASMSSSLPCN